MDLLQKENVETKVFEVRHCNCRDIRSAALQRKHSSSTAYSHGLDYGRLMDLPEFEDIMHFQGNVKPVHVVIADGGPDENPRFRKVIDVAIHNFRKYKLDALFVATNAPGRSAFNRVERRMAPLSRELVGLVLPHDHYGSHLDDKL
uniref:Uncharacterized protein n=1 Tax=Anopheles minimus TaxID=112268 RepID=A0A182W7W0_9DIPT